MKYLLINLIKGYKRYVSPYLVFLFGSGCRYQPTCSEYSIKALERFGLVKGISLSTKRFFSCHPFSKGGYNPVPEVR
jgi:putative membrane protein insertion efficiency factor